MQNPFLIPQKVLTRNFFRCKLATLQQHHPDLATWKLPNSCWLLGFVDAIRLWPYASAILFLFFHSSEALSHAVALYGIASNINLLRFRKRVS